MQLVHIEGDNVTHALEEALIKFPIFGRQEQSRNGPVLAMPGPTYISIDRPWERVLFDPRRDANPFFHLAEFVWMMSGSNNVRFIEHYNKRMRQYADPGTDVHHGAYGHRWRKHFNVDQILQVVQLLRSDPTTRRAVLGMWDPEVDLSNHADLPCNTHIYFRAPGGVLHMTVCNRSNDLLWGCLGANAVHMTLLHELVARATGLAQGTYNVFTNNLHIYRTRSDVERMLGAPPLTDYYTRKPYIRTEPLLDSRNPSETLGMFLYECEYFVKHGTLNPEAYTTKWFRNTFIPAMRNFEARKLVAEIAAPDWSIACAEWLARRATS